MANIEKIAALLALAERTDNEAEADAYMTKAQSLATLHSVDLAVAQAKIAKREKREQPISKQITIGERGKHANKHLVSLFIAIAGQNDVEVDIAHNSTYVVAFGFGSDIEVCEALWGSLAFQMVHAANEYLKEGEWKGTYYRKRVNYGRGRYGMEEALMTGKVARASFYRGYISRIGDRLSAARQQAIQEAQEAQEMAAALAPTATDAEAAENVSTSVPSAALVMKEKKDEIRSFYKKASTARGSWGGYSGSGSTSTSAAIAGRSAANAARLTSSKGITSRAGAIA